MCLPSIGYKRKVATDIGYGKTHRGGTLTNASNSNISNMAHSKCTAIGQYSSLNCHWPGSDENSLLKKGNGDMVSGI
jgi:hypothetical protein